MLPAVTPAGPALLSRNMWSPAISQLSSISVLSVITAVLLGKLSRCTFLEINIETISALDDIIKSKMLRHHDGMYGCSECDYSTKYYTTIQNHIEYKHLSTSGFYCKYCEKFCPTRKGLNKIKVILLR